MDKKKKVFSVGIVTVAIMLPIIGRAIGQYNIQSQYESNKTPQEVMNDVKIQRTEELKDSYKECKEHMGTYTLDFKNNNETNLVDNLGNIVMESVFTLKNINFSYYLISNIEGSYIFNVEKSELSPFYEEAYDVYIQEESARVSAIAYKTLKTDKVWNLQTRDTLYENFEINGKTIGNYTYFDVSSGIPKVVK